MILDPTFVSNLILVLTGFGGAFLAALWISLVIWTYRDIRTRARDPLVQTLATLLVAVLNLPGILVYLILRPPRTLEEEYQRTRMRLLTNVGSRVIEAYCITRTAVLVAPHGVEWWKFHSPASWSTYEAAPSTS